MKGKTQVSISIEIELRQKLDLYAKDTRRNRSQAVETTSKANRRGNERSV